MSASHPTPGLIILKAEPEPLQIDLTRMAVVVIDMQNAFVSKGGMFDLSGEDITRGQRIIEPIKGIIRAARARGVRVIYVVHHYSPDLREAGGPDSGYWYGPNLRKYREDPEWKDKFIIRDTWGAEIVKELEPREDKLVVVKPRYSAFFGTNLDAILKSFNIKYLAFVGVATNICVEAAIRDACYLDYFPILILDATASAGPEFTQEATIFNVKLCFGWVTTSQNIIKAIEPGKKNPRV